MLKKMILSIAISSTIFISNSYGVGFELPSVSPSVVGENISLTSTSSSEKKEKKENYYRCSCGNHLKNNNLQMVGISDMVDVGRRSERTVIGVVNPPLER
jgi:hypothetical protein